MLNSIRRPVRPRARVRCRKAIQMKSDRPRVPREGVVVMIQTVPAGKKCSIRTIRRRRRAEFLAILVFGNAESSLLREHGRHMKRPISGTVARVELARDRSISPIQACLPAKASLFCSDRLIDQALG